MNKVFVLKPNEDWIVDRFVKEWYEDNADISSSNPLEANVIWLFSDWCWKKFHLSFLETKKIITTIHHIVPEKFQENDLLDFSKRDSITSVYHVPNIHTKSFIKNLTSKPVHVIPYWANQKIWKKTSSKEYVRKTYSIPQNAYVIGSFQRDTEGYDLASPKLEKGPDLLADFLELESKKRKDLHVILAGWRRQYIINRLSQAKISFSYFERPSQEVINELYQTLDLYPVTARYEGGPQSLIECGLLQVPVVSRDIGIASQILPSCAISNDINLANGAIPKVSELCLPQGYKPYRELIQSL